MKQVLNFTDIGAGETVLVFLHYFGGSSRTWHQVTGELSDCFRCIAIDLPGFGDSQEVVNKLSVSECAAEVSKVTELLSLKKYVLIGHSMGGKIAAYIASKQPAALVSLILVAPSPPSPEPMTDEERSQLLHSYADRAALEKNLAGITAQPLSPAEKESLLRDNLKVSKKSWDWWVEEGSREDLTAETGISHLPALVISGAEDSQFSKGFLEDVLSLHFPSATFVDIPNAAHLVPVDAPALLANEIATFTSL